MTGGQRKAHLVIWIVLTPPLILGVIMAVRVMQAPPLSGLNDTGEIDRAGGSGP